jgi:hypothetical protein
VGLQDRGIYEESTISNSYAAGTVTGENDVGGVLGYYIGGEISSIYYDMQTSWQSDIGKHVGRTTAQMKRQSTFAGWDFGGIWGISSEINCGYPHLLGFEYGSGCNITPIRLPQIASSQISVRTASNAIVLENLPRNAKVQIYNVHGKSIYSGNPENPEILKIMVQAKGIYIVKAGKETFRVAVR